MPKTKPTPQLLELPRETKWIIFDLFLKSFTIRPAILETYALPYQWPGHSPDLSVYLALVSTCKELRAEAQAYFEQRCLPKMTFYFDKVPYLYDFYQDVKAAQPDYLKAMRFSLRSRCQLLCPDPNGSEKKAILIFIMNNTTELIPHLVHTSFSVSERPATEGWYESPGGSLHVQHRGTTIIDALHMSTHNLKIVGREIRGLQGSNYLEMTGTFSALDWSGYDHEVVKESYLEALCTGAEELQQNHGNNYTVGMEKLVMALRM